MPKFAQKRGKFNILVDLGINTHYQYKAFRMALRPKTEQI